MKFHKSTTQSNFKTKQKRLYENNQTTNIKSNLICRIPLGSLTVIRLPVAVGLLSPASFTANTRKSYSLSSIRLGTLKMFGGDGTWLMRTQFSEFASFFSIKQPKIRPPPSLFGLSQVSDTKSPPTSCASGSPGGSGGSAEKIFQEIYRNIPLFLTST